MRTFQKIVVQEASQVGEARRAGLALAREMGFDETSAAKVGICVTEAAGNLVKHTREGGEILLRAPSLGCIELVAIDSGPGMRDVGVCLSDGYSTAGTQGTGLGALKRQSSDFDLYSVAGKGTVIYARIDSAAGKREPRRLPELGAVCLPVTGETACGDDWAVKDWGDSHVWYVVADGLGHGPIAHEAADEAIRSLERQKSQSLPDYFQTTHNVLRSTRGAAVSIASVDRANRCVTFCGIGNVSGVLLSSNGSKSMVSMNGTLGYGMRKVQEFKYPLEPDSVMVLFSDGLISHWALENYPGLLARHPQVIAAVLYRDYSRGRDDVTVLVAKGLAS